MTPRALIVLLLALVGSVALGIFLVRDPGYLLIAVGPWSVETTLSLAVLALLLFYLLLYYALGLLFGLLALPERNRRWRRRRRLQRARNSLYRGLELLAEGRWRAAEKELIRLVEASEAPLLNYLGAARAAQGQRQPQRRDRYLHKAHSVAPQKELAVGLTQAELQQAQGQLEQALATLKRLQGIAPRNPHLVELHLNLVRLLKEWDEVLELLPPARKLHLLENGAVSELEQEAHRHRFLRVVADGSLEQIRQAWSRLPKRLREQPEIARPFIEALVEGGEEQEAEGLIRGLLKHHWESALVHLYGRLEGVPAGRRLAQVESWLKLHPGDGALLLTAGRLCLQERLWGKARSYLEASLGAAPSAEAWQELGRLLDRMDEKEKARACFEEGLALATGQPVRELPPINNSEPAAATPPEPPPDALMGVSPVERG